MKEPSFSQRLKAGWSKGQLMQFYALTEQQYQKIIASVASVRCESLFRPDFPGDEVGTARRRKDFKAALLKFVK